MQIEDEEREMINKKMLGDFIYALRKEKGYSQSELGDLVGVSNKAVSKWETNEANPDLSVVPKLAEALGVTADELLEGKRKEVAGCAAVNRSAAAFPYGYGSDFWGGDVVREPGHFEYTSRKKTKSGLPYVHINIGFGYKAHGIVAVGLRAKGVVSIGLLSVGIFSTGLLSVGILGIGLLSISLLIALGGVCVSLGAAVGGVAVGSVAVGGVAIGILSVGGVSIGVYAYTGTGGFAYGRYTYYLESAASTFAVPYFSPYFITR